MVSAFDFMNQIEQDIDTYYKEGVHYYTEGGEIALTDRYADEFEDALA